MPQVTCPSVAAAAPPAAARIITARSAVETPLIRIPPNGSNASFDDAHADARASCGTTGCEQRDRAENQLAGDTTCSACSTDRCASDGLMNSVNFMARLMALASTGQPCVSPSGLRMAASGTWTLHAFGALQRHGGSRIVLRCDETQQR